MKVSAEVSAEVPNKNLKIPNKEIKSNSAFVHNTNEKRMCSIFNFKSEPLHGHFRKSKVLRYQNFI